MRWPEIKVILLSGRLASLRDLPPIVFLPKPTTPMALAMIIECAAVQPASALNLPKNFIFN
jgi:hypothetical protein